MADDCNSKSTLGLNRSTQEQPRQLSISDGKDGVVQENSDLNSDVYPHNSSHTVLEKANSGKFEGEKEDNKNVLCDIVKLGAEGEEKAGNDEDAVVLEEKAGVPATCLNGAVFKNQESAYVSSSAGCSNDTVLDGQESNFVDCEIVRGAVVLEEETVEKAGVPATCLNDTFFKNQESASVPCSAADGPNDTVLDGQESKAVDCEIARDAVLKVEVIDETALVETADLGKTLNFPEISRKNGGNKEKRPRRRGKSGKTDNISEAIGEQKFLEKRVYSREELEGLRFAGIDGQRKKWLEVYCGLGPAVQKEYDELVNSDKQQKKKKNVHVNFDPRFRNDALPSVLGGEQKFLEKRVYSREELEGLRFAGIDGQRKKWLGVYCGLGPAVQKEYDELVNSDKQQKKKKNVHVNFDPRFRNDALPSVLGEESSENADNEIPYENPMDPASGLLPVNDQNGCLIEQGECIEYDSDEDYSSIQKPAFFVMGEPDFDSGPPEDGLEYLRRVRWEAAQIPKVKVANINRSKLNKEQTVYMPQIPDVAKCPEHLMPLKEWEDAFLADFSELRLALSRLETSEAKMQSSSSVHEEESSSKLFETILIENFDDTSVVEDSCQSTHCYVSQTCGNQCSSAVANDNDGLGSIDSPTPKLYASGVSGKRPTLSMILRMDSVARVSTLRKRISIADSMASLSWDDCLWLFALSAVVDCPLDADTCAAFRSLLRKCASLRAEKLELDEEVAMLNILATISGKYFGQEEN